MDEAFPAPEVIPLGNVTPEVIRLSPATGDATDVSLEPEQELMEAEAQKYIGYITQQEDESDAEFESDVRDVLFTLVKEFKKGDLGPHPRDGKFKAQWRNAKFELARRLLEAKPELADVKGTHLHSLQLYYASKLQASFTAQMQQIYDEVVQHQSAVGQAVEPDVPQAEDEVVAHLRELGIQIPIPEAGAPSVEEILRSFRDAKIDQDEGAMDRMVAKTGLDTTLTFSGELPSTKKIARKYAEKLSKGLAPGPENEMRRNWFKSVIPSSERQVRVEADIPDWEHVTLPPRPTAIVDPGTNLLRPPAKKGARPQELSEEPVGSPPASMSQRLLDGLQAESKADHDAKRARTIHDILQTDYDFSGSFMDRTEQAQRDRRNPNPRYRFNNWMLFGEGVQERDDLMRKFAASLYGSFPPDRGSNVAPLTDRSKNPRWAGYWQVPRCVRSPVVEGGQFPQRQRQHPQIWAQVRGRVWRLGEAVPET